MKIFLKKIETDLKTADLTNIYIVETGLRPVSTLFISVLIFFSLFSCSSDHLIKNIQYRTLTGSIFEKKKDLASKRDSALFSVFNQKLTIEQSEALKFLYAFMPLSDLADYNGDFFLGNVNISLKARKEMVWGKDIPEEIFLHYVLPYRVNNENLDSFRIAYYDELRKRVNGKDIREAALEINHWCHEKVNYHGSDIRTSAPMSTILSTRGRCGEESTFTVAALRTVGIPARQVYTPRWAHTDDNHAWVEIWSGGEWYYMGACEPEATLDYGWFTEPARRAMLVHTKSFGAWIGEEKVITKNLSFTDVNNLAKYAITKKIIVSVRNKNELPVSNALVEYQLYNYAEFYPLAVVPTDSSGLSSFETGLGDLLIWAHKGDDFAFSKISVGETDTLILKISSDPVSRKDIDLDLNVPIVRTPLPTPSKELLDRNSLRFNSENMIRQMYINTWMKPGQSRDLAVKLKLDTATVRGLIEKSMGNYREISSFILNSPDSLRKMSISLLQVLPEKDLRDVKQSTLRDHLINSFLYTNTSAAAENKMFVEYILNPRIGNELLSSWRHYLLTRLPAVLLNNAKEDPTLIIKYLNENIRISEDDNYYGTPITPIGVDELKVSDKNSRAIYFVAICRSLGIPSRMEPSRSIPQYFSNNEWVDVYFHDQTKPDSHKGYLKLQSTDTNPVPEYYIHFTLARFEEGRYNTLEYDFNKKITEFKEEIPLPPGHYMFVTGNRLIDSRILSRLTFFDLSENEHKIVNVKIRKDASEMQILGKIDLKKITSLNLINATSEACVIDKGTVIIWIDPESEPTKHIFNDLPLLKKELDKTGVSFLFLSGNNNGVSTFTPVTIKNLPLKTSFSIDSNLSILKNNIVALNGHDPLLNHPELNLPVVLVTDKDGNILFKSEGYRIGIGEQILKNFK